MCRTRRGAAELARAGRDRRGEWYVGTGPGRGVWWCLRGECAAGVTPGHLARALRAEVTKSQFEFWRALVPLAGRPAGREGVKE